MSAEPAAPSIALPGSSKRALSVSPSDEDASDAGQPVTKRAKHERVDDDSTRAQDDSGAQLEAMGAGRDKKKRRKKKRKMPIMQQRDRSPEKAVAPGPKTPPRRLSASVPPGRTTSPTMRVAPTIPLVSSSSSPVVSPVAKPLSAPQTYEERGIETERLSSPPSIDKGKQRAVSPLEPSTSQTGADDADLARHRALASSLFPSLTCQICLLLMNHPFALAPCGHVACHSCLVSWFTNDPANQNPIPNPNPPAADGNAAQAVPAGLGGLPRVPALALRRKKTCPHCRAVVRERPVEVWAIKEMVAAVVKSGLADVDAVPLELRPSGGAADAASGSSTPNEDPWKDVFPPLAQVGRGAGGIGELSGIFMRETLGIQDEEDGGIYRCVDCAHEIWDGVCAACGRVYPGHRRDGGGAGGGGGGEVGGVHFGLEDLLGARIDWDEDDEDDGIDDDAYDEFDLFRRLAYPERRYMDVTLTDEEEDDEDEDQEDDPGLRELDEDDNEGAEAEDDEQGYESSFIDDEDEVVEVTAAEVHGRGRRRQPPPIVISDSEDEDVRVLPPNNSGNAHRNRGRAVVVSDHEDAEDGEAEDETNLAAVVAQRERVLYGDDGSLPARRHRHIPDEEDMPTYVDTTHYSDDDAIWDLDEDGADEDDYMYDSEY